MSKYIAISTIRLEHDYYNPPTSRHFRLELMPKTKELMRRRGVLFIQTNHNEWQWLTEEDNTKSIENEEMELAVIVTDPDFMLQVAIKEYNPQILYQINLDRDIIIDEEYSMSPVSGKTKFHGEFCRIVLKPKEKYTIKFCSCSYYWEYLFIFRDEPDLHGERLILESMPREAISFHSPEKYEHGIMSQKNVWRIVSEKKIKVQEHYDFRLSVYDNSPNGNGRKIISRFITSPRLNKFVADRSDILREIIYL